MFPDPQILDSYYEYWIPQDDLDTEELMDNMRAIKGISKITFYDNHDKLMKDWLLDNRPKFVFHQCDDGFMNKEELEVHLNAYMDMLDIPYTGPGVEGVQITKDKSLVRGAAHSVGVPAPLEIYIDVHDSIEKKIPQVNKRKGGKKFF